MEFNYYLSQTPIDPSSVVEFIPYDVSHTFGDFTINLSGNILESEMEHSSGLDSFTLILTFETIVSKSQILLSNCDSSKGFTVGLTSGNFLFVESPYDGEVHVFHNINLGNKNCICIQKSGNIFNIFKFDLISDKLESSESYIFNVNNNVDSGTPMFLAGNPDYLLATNSTVGYFSGRIEQWCLMNDVYDIAYLLILSQGFQPKTLVSSSDTSITLLDSSIRFPDSYNKLSNTNFIEAYFSNINNQIISSALPSGRWIASSTGHFNPSYTSGVASFSTGLTNCLGSGNYLTLYYSGQQSSQTGRFYDTINLIKRSGVYSISHSLRFSGQSFESNEYRIDADYYYGYVSTSSNEFTIDTSYYTGFIMQGIVSDRFLFNVLGTDTGNLPYTYNNIGVFDNVSGKFYLSNFSNGRIYFDGTGVPSGGYSNENGWIDVLNIDESESDYILYDNSTGLTPLYAGVNGYAVGDFYPNSSIVFSGDNSYTSVKRVSREYYKETCERHLYHSSKVQGLGEDLFFTI